MSQASPAGIRDAHEVVVIGGGPAGSTCATILAQHGRDVLLLEKERFPRFHIGESLMPLTYWPFKRVGILEKLRQSPFVKKYSVQFINEAGRMSQPFYFTQTHPHESSQTWQVTRSVFDQMMLDNAREHGVTVRESTLVREVRFEGGRATGVTLCEAAGGAEREVAARVVVDASGGNALLARKLNIRRPDPKLRKAAVFAHFQDAYRDTGVDEGATLVIHVAERRGWFWYIPLENGITSVGVVGDLDYLLKGRQGDPARVLDEEIQRCPGVRPRMENARRVGDVHVLSDFSWSARQCAGDGWVLVGDAFAFLDPIYSSGLFLALASGERAADAIHAALAADDLSAARLGDWGDEFFRGLQAMRKLVYAYYSDGFSFGEFMRRHPETRKDLVGLLIGDVFTPAVENVFGPMSRMIPLPDALGLDPPRPIAPPARAPAPGAVA